MNKKRIDVLSLGAGTQSSAMLLMAAHGKLPRPDFVIFSDTGWEPEEVYQWLEKLKKYIEPFGMKIETVSKGNIREDVLESQITGKRCSSLPFYTFNEMKQEKGITMRQCTFDYKIAPIRKKIRELLGYQPRQKVREEVHMWRGISTDEIMRVKPSQTKWIIHDHPLIDLGMNRLDCINYVESVMKETPPKSSCIGCPFHNNEMWLHIKKTDANGWKQAVELDLAIRNNPKYKSKLFLHKSCLPLSEVDLMEDQMTIDDFDNECYGMCGI
jgi:hypothetical protein